MRLEEKYGAKHLFDRDDNDIGIVKIIGRKWMFVPKDEDRALCMEELYEIIAFLQELNASSHAPRFENRDGNGA